MVGRFNKLLVIIKVLFGNKRTKEILLFVLLFLTLFKPAIDPDFWWHLKYAELVVNKRVFLVSDIFSYTMSGYKWADSYWLSEVIMYELVKIGGHVLMSVVFTALLSFFLIIATRRYQNFYARTLTLIVCSLSFNFFIVTAKPMLFSTIFMFLLWSLFVFKEAAEFDKYAWLLPFLFLVWTNMHADFVIGLALLTLYCFVRAIKPPLNFVNLRLLLVLIFCFAATLLNPYGLLLHKTLLREIVTMPTQLNTIAEWMPAALNQTLFIYQVVLCAAVLFTLLSFMKNSSEIKSKMFVSVVLLSTIALSFRSAYFLKLLAVFSFPLVYVFFEEVFSMFKGVIVGNKVIGYLAIIIPVFTFLLFVGFLGNFTAPLTTLGLWELRKDPYKAVEFLNSTKVEGNMLNESSWGGYLIYYSPGHPVFYDGRMVAWGDSKNNFLDDYLTLMFGKDTMEREAVLNKHKIAYALLPKGKNSYKFFRDALKWEVLYEDNIAIILKRKA